MLAISLQEARSMIKDIEKVRDESTRQETLLHRDQLLHRTQAIKLVKELGVIYPISMDSVKGYLIRGLQLPVDIYTTTVSEEEISAALGFTCHLTFMMSKYLSISLRHKIHVNSSRSVIIHQVLDGGPTILPLFLALLLGANVDCILGVCQINYTPRSHILARIKRVLDVILEGR